MAAGSPITENGDKSRKFARENAFCCPTIDPIVRETGRILPEKSRPLSIPDPITVKACQLSHGERSFLQDVNCKTNSLRRLPVVARTAIALGLFSLISACAESPTYAKINPERQSMALREVAQKQADGQRVWCVPYARNLSGINIRGNAKNWWSNAHKIYARGTEPDVGAVMSFRATGGMPLGHVAVVSDIVTDREIIVNHANWHRNKVSLKMGVKDVSKHNDWTLVRVESRPGQYGKFYPVNGFIYPKSDGIPTQAAFMSAVE